MISEELAASLVVALMQEAEIDLDKEVEQYAEKDEYDEDDSDLQSDTEEALADVLLLFFQSLPEQTQEEIKQAIRRFTVRPDWVTLKRWQMEVPISLGEIMMRNAL